MASPSSLILLHLLFLSAGNFLLRTNASALDDICRQTSEPPRCTSILKSTDTRSPTATLPILAQITIDATSYNAGQTKIKVHNLLVSAKDPKIQTVYRNCENLYLDALDALQIAPEYLKQRNYAKLTEVAGTVARAVGNCAAALSAAPLNRENKDVGVVGEAIAAVAKNLH